MIQKYRQNAELLAGEAPEFSAVTKPFFHILDFVVDEPYRGACHAISAILYVILRELNIDATICLGELGKDRVCFDHSWVEVSGKIFDISIARPLDSTYDGSPIFMGRNLETLGEPFWKYGISSGIGDDPFVLCLKAGSFGLYMDNAPVHKNGLWYFVQKFGNRCGLQINLNKIRQKYANVQWRCAR
ncbi:MAG: hypothetical protein JWM68_3667 [Verrucomicrobiales bacterium]|nr:hypothetical protein [Verrucomicrobiales bacterium]